MQMENIVHSMGLGVMQSRILIYMLYQKEIHRIEGEEQYKAIDLLIHEFKKEYEFTNDIEFKRITFITFDKGMDFGNWVTSITSLCESKVHLVFPEAKPIHPKDLSDNIYFVCNKTNMSCLIISFSSTVLDTIRLYCIRNSATKDLSMYFISKEGLKELKMDRYGGMSEWPANLCGDDCHLLLDLMTAGDEAHKRRLEEIKGIDGQYLKDCKDLLEKGQKVAAIKLYRQATELGLKESKEAIEAIEETMKYEKEYGINGMHQ